jgi:AraC-like DNA-binding protein
VGRSELIEERGVTERSPWSLARGRPHPGLAGDVQAYFGYTKQTDVPILRREVPHGVVTLMLAFGDPMDFLPPAGTGPPVDRMVSFVGGLHEAHTNTRHAGDHQGIEIQLTPLGAARVLGVAPMTLTNAVVPFDAVRGRAAGDLVARLAEADDWPTRFRLLDRSLRCWVDGAPAPDPAVAWAWDQIRRSRGQVRISTLADEIGWSRRHFATRFRDGVGLTPKAVARVLRFRRAVELLTIGPSASIGEVAAACGFTDHSHLVRDFRSMAGYTPSELIADRGAGTLPAAFPHTTP